LYTGVYKYDEMTFLQMAGGNWQCEARVYSIFGCNVKESVVISGGYGCRTFDTVSFDTPNPAEGFSSFWWTYGRTVFL